MAIDTTADNAVIYSDFAVSAVFTVTGGGTVTVNGIFTNPSDSHDIGGLGTLIEAAAPSFMTPTAGISTVRRGNTVVINTVTYTVERIERVGTADSVVYLKT